MKGFIESKNKEIEIPLCDIKNFIIGHQSGYNGYKIYANIKDELVKPVCYFDESEIVGKKYEAYERSILIRIKDEPKLRKKLYSMFIKRNGGSILASELE